MLKKITSLQHPLVKHLVKVRQNHDYRYEHKSVIVEGTKPLRELSGSQQFKTLVVLEESLIPEGISLPDSVIVTREIMQKISGMQTPEGVLAEIVMPPMASLIGLKRLIALDGVSDPGNLGTLLRTALALGWEGAFLVNESCDPFNEKALRAARGATFRLPIGTGTWKELKQLIANSNLLPLAADLEGEDIRKFHYRGGVLLIMGNEAHGLSEEASQLCRKITIPMKGPMESLNVSIAGGILMFALMGGSS